MGYQFYDATVIEIINETEHVRRFVLKMPESIQFRFKAGQFIMIDLPIDSKLTNRSFSIASAPSNNNVFEICIVRKEIGIGTTWIWEHVLVGTILKCSDALGKFVLSSEVIDSDICFIATGTGIAPLRSMIFDIYNNNITHKNIYLIFGNRNVGDILYRQEFEKLTKLHPEFHFIPVLSRETTETWNGALGYIHQSYLNIFADKRKALFYICGWNKVVKEARDNLKQMGYTKNEMKFELYD